MRNFVILTLASVCLSSTLTIASTDCIKVAATTKTLIETTPENVLNTVGSRVEEFPSCACEIVKTAIQSTHADVELVAKIVETAILSAPDHMRIIAQCAIAVAPDALPAIQAVLAKLDPHAGDSYSSKSSKYSGKGGKEVAAAQEQASVANPLDFPGIGPVGPIDGLSGGALPGGDPFTDPFFPGGFPTNPVNPPVDTLVNP